MKPLGVALGRAPKAVGAWLGKLWEFFSGAKENEEAKRQAATQLAGLIDSSWDLLASGSSDWKQGRINYETITALDHYATALDNWHKDSTLLFQRQLGMLGHVHRYSLFLHQAISHLRELHNANRKYVLVPQMNVCELRLELARDTIHSHIAELTSTQDHDDVPQR
jgi:hypothetical protein